MRTLGWGGIAVLTLLAGAAFAAAQPPKGKGMPDGWWNDLFGPSKPKPLDDAKKDPKAQPGPKPPSRAEREQELLRLEAALLRREAVCNRLSDLGMETEANRLYELACALHNRQVRALGMAGYVSPEDEEPAGAYELPQPAREPRMMVPSRLRTGGLDAGISEPSRSWGDER
jgi:hypothetical protein